MSWEWIGVGVYSSMSYVCGYCGNKVAPDQGYGARHKNTGAYRYIFICPNCAQPTYFADGGKQTPSVRIGNDVADITDSGVSVLYNQARDCISVGAYTASTLLCRKILMNLAVQYGAEAGKSFIEYIDYLDNAGHIPPNGKAWVDRNRAKGNEVAHEIRLIEENEALQIIKFTELFLKFSYEFLSIHI